MDEFGAPVVSAPDADGYAHFQLSGLEDQADQYIAFNATSGDVEVFAGTNEALLPAETGDEVCLFETDATGAGPYWCVSVP